MGTISYKKALAFVCALVHALWWVVVLVHLQSQLHSGGFDASALDPCPTAQRGPLALSLSADSPDDSVCRAVAKQMYGSSHEKSHCGICSFAGTKILQGSCQDTLGVAPLGSIVSFTSTPPPVQFAVAGSIRAPPAPHPSV